MLAYYNHRDNKNKKLSYRREAAVTFANPGSVRRLPSLKFVGLRVRKIRSIWCVSCSRPGDLDLLTLKRVHGSWVSMVPNMGFRGLSVLDLGRGMGRTDRQTTASNARGHNK